MKFTIMVSILLFLVGCGTSSKKETMATPYPESRSDKAESLPEADGQNIDYMGLQRSLALDRSFDDLGYSEKEFNTCQVGNGYSPSRNCQHQYFVVINFRLLCRDTEGTISEVVMDADLTPIAQKNLKWVLKGPKGVLQTDDGGYGQIRTVSSVSQRHQRLKITLGSEFLYVRANEITKITTPKPWCDQVH